MSYLNPQQSIAIFGSNGMAGGAITRHFYSKGFRNLLTPSRHDLDLTHYSSVNGWFAHHKPEIVILAAAKVGGILANNLCPGDFLLDNLKIQTNVIESAWKYSARRLLFLGSSCVYPKFASQPISEDELLNGPLEPTNESYAIAKIAGLKLCKALKSQYDLDAISLMPTNLYGPGDNYDENSSHVLASFIRRFHTAMMHQLPSVTCWGTGTPKREFMHVDDLAEACYFCLDKWFPSKTDPAMLNAGTGVDLSIRELAYKVANVVGYKGKILWDSNKPDGTPRKLLNISKIKSLGWSPKIDLDSGIVSTVYHYSKSIHSSS